MSPTTFAKDATEVENKITNAETKLKIILFNHSSEIFIINNNNLNQKFRLLVGDYKKIKKYMKSNLYEVKIMEGTEDKVSKLLEEYGGDLDED